MNTTEPTSQLSASEARQPDDEMTFANAPNILTLIRICFVPVVVALLFLRSPTWDIVAAVLFGVASITDYFDGYLARTRNQVTIYGKLMDPLADKFLVVSALIMLQALERIHPIVVILTVCREFAITGLRALASAEGVIIPASKSAKWKTTTQMIGIPFMMVKDGFWGIPFFAIGEVLIYISLAISLWSASDYVIDFFRALAKAQRLKREARISQKQSKRQAKLQGRLKNRH